MDHPRDDKLGGQQQHQKQQAAFNIATSVEGVVTSEIAIGSATNDTLLNAGIVPKGMMPTSASSVSEPAIVGGRIGRLATPQLPQQQTMMATTTPPLFNPLTNSHNGHAPLYYAQHPQFLSHCNLANSSLQNQSRQQAQEHVNDGKLRSGKWIAEEEIYAMQLIETFEKGVATDCVNGSTLRAYLATKLLCAPMRISKKFAGKGIGKMVYLGKHNHHRHGVGGPDPGLATKLRETEEKFYQAIFPMRNLLEVCLLLFVCQ